MGSQCRQQLLIRARRRHSSACTTLLLPILHARQRSSLPRMIRTAVVCPLRIVRIVSGSCQEFLASSSVVEDLFSRLLRHQMARHVGAECDRTKISDRE